MNLVEDPEEHGGNDVLPPEGEGRRHPVHLSRKRRSLHCKKGLRFSHPQPSSDSPWPGIIKLFPARESLVSDITAGDGKIDNFFAVKIFGILTVRTRSRSR